MQGQVSINVHVSTESPLHGVVTAVGAGDELFQAVLTRGVREQLDPGYRGQLVGIRWSDPDYPERLHMIYPAEMTMAAAREYFGDEADAMPPSIHVDEGGYGGDGLVAYAIELLSTGMEVAGYVAATLAMQRGVIKLRYSRYRRLATDWNDSGFISPDLREAVMAKQSWNRSDFDTTFGLDSSRGPLLLRTLGYSRRDYDWGAQYWERPLDD